MTKQEAIKIIKDNYPPKEYDMLREALDLAIKTLTEPTTAKERVQQELNELTEKQEKLKNFNQSNMFKTLPLIQQVLLENQEDTMMIYANILCKRLAYWDTTNTVQ